MAGLAAFGDSDNAMGISRSGRSLVLWMREKGVQTPLARAELTGGATLDLRITAKGGRRFQFAYSTDGSEWRTLGDETEGGYLPPWDRAVRVALAVGGPPGGEDRFDWVRIETALH
jgi:hypothetical protein